MLAVSGVALPSIVVATLFFFLISNLTSTYFIISGVARIPITNEETVGIINLRRSSLVIWSAKFTGV
jgi:hypothetical protein